MFYNQHIFNQKSDPLRLKGLQKSKAGVESPNTSRRQIDNIKERIGPGGTNRYGKLERVSASVGQLLVSFGQPFPVFPELIFDLSYKSN